MDSDDGKKNIQTLSIRFRDLFAIVCKCSSAKNTFYQI